MNLFSPAIFLSFAVIVQSNVGFNADQPISSAAFECMKCNGYNFFVGRTYKADGEVDYKGVQNIRNAVAAGLSSVHAFLHPCMISTCPSAEKQVGLAINTTKGTQFGTLWLDIDLFLSWPADKSFNRQFILDMIHAATNMGHSVGIYTESNSWLSVVGDWNGASQYPLWWLSYTVEPNFDNFTPFGGWDKPQVRQYNANLPGPCSVGKISVNYYEE